MGVPNSKIYIKKILTVADKQEDGNLTIKFFPNDTKDLQPYKYLYSFAYMPNNGEDVYTYETGVFEILPAVCTVDEVETYDERI